jgi:uroporphyrinogen decarboxylase
MHKRDAVLSLLDPDAPQGYVPAGFFIHFDPSCHFGPAAVDKHLEFFRYTGMDFVKIQYERAFPLQPEIRQAADWAKMPLHGKDFYEPQLGVVHGLVQAAKKEALVIVTLYSAFMCANHASQGLLTEHLQQDPEQAQKGLEIVTESLMSFVKGCIELGVDGFYASTQGRESHRFADRALFDEYVRPYDLALLEEIDRACIFNVLHVCDYHDEYDDVAPFVDYPGHVVNCNLNLEGHKLSAGQVAEMFGRPYMGGLDRKGVIATGSQAEIRREVQAVLDDAPDRFILAADCTLPGDVDWDNIKTAIETAHAFRDADER